jgi:hypothetical protein
MVNMRWNQVAENTRCNSFEYNPMYNPIQFRDKLDTIDASINTTFVQPHRMLFAKMVGITTHRNPPPQHRRDNGEELNQRGLEVKTTLSTQKDISQRPEIVTYAVEYSYRFDYQSTSHTSYSCCNSYDVIINNHQINVYCLRVLPNNRYIFIRTIRAFHFTFHAPAVLRKEEKYKGAFHLKVDMMNTNNTVPYRPFIVDHQVNRFYRFDDFDTLLDGLYTSTDTSLDINELKLFRLKEPSVVTTYMVNGSMVDYITDIVKPIYDIIVQDVLNPLAATELVGIVFTTPVPYIPNRRVRYCRMARVYGGSRTRRTLKKRCKPDRKGPSKRRTIRWY